PSIVWERGAGKPVHNAIVWQCRRTAEICNDLKSRGLAELFKSKTGLVIDAYFSGTKVCWILNNNPGSREKAGRGELLFGTVDSYLLYRLTGGRVHATDLSNASRTMIFNIHNLKWDEELCRILDIPAAMLPRASDSASVFGRTEGLGFLPDGIPISGIAGDQQAALFGQGCFSKGDSKCTGGTGAFLLVNTGEKAFKSDRGLLTTIAWGINGKTSYALEGSAFIAGAAVQWVRDSLKLIGKASEIEELAKTVENSGGVVFIPALAGLGAPYWRPEARGAMFGLSRATNAGHIARAVLEGIAMNVADLFFTMESDSIKINSLMVDGGACQNNLLMQFQSDILRVPIVRPKNIDTTAFGAAYLAGIGAGIFKDFGEISNIRKIDKEFTPEMRAEKAQELVKDYRKKAEIV
ncbi:MAG: glycerol kinase, partial [Deltaproteobacteria bacterium]|nr:glycerol kinase [Deltaproteobacteria bacterium]